MLYKTKLWVSVGMLFSLRYFSLLPSELWDIVVTYYIFSYHVLVQTSLPSVNHCRKTGRSDIRTTFKMVLGNEKLFRVNLTSNLLKISEWKHSYLCQRYSLSKWLREHKQKKANSVKKKFHCTQQHDKSSCLYRSLQMDWHLNSRVRELTSCSPHDC